MKFFSALARCMCFATDVKSNNMLTKLKMMIKRNLYCWDHFNTPPQLHHQTQTHRLVNFPCACTNKETITQQTVRIQTRSLK
jgi:hypothetical protein